MNNLNVFGKEWTDLVFDGRNKLYGAYKLRQDDVKNTALALFIGIGGMCLIFGSSYLYASKLEPKFKIVNLPDTDPIITDSNATIDPKPTVEPKNDIKPVVDNSKKTSSSARTDVQENIKFTQTNIVDDNKATDQLAAQDDFTDSKQAGTKNSLADELNGKLKSDGSVTGLSSNGDEGTNKDTTTETNTKDDDFKYKLVQYKAEPLGGFQKFYSTFGKKFDSEKAKTNLNEITVRVRFVVEKDGSFSEITVLDDQFGIGNEATRVLKSMPKWKPAQHNGKTVRSFFTLPITVKLN